MAFYVKLLAILAKLGPKIPQAIELLNALYKLFADSIESPSGGLSIVKPSAEALKLEAKIAKKLSPKGRQQAFDFGRIRALAKWLNDSGMGAMIIKLFGLL